MRAAGPAMPIAALSAVLAACLLAGCGTSGPAGSKRAAQAVTDEPPPDPPPAVPYARRPAGSLTFTSDVAPIIFQNCAVCHRPGEIGPFPLLSYADFRKRDKLIVEVTRTRFMPPWSPVPGYCTFEQDRGLSRDAIGLIAQWVEEGSVEGDPSRLPALPKFRDGWRYGKPDLVLKMAEPYEIAPDAKNVYRKFVLPTSLGERKYIRAFDFDPGTRRVVHHMRIRVDSTSASRSQDERDPLPGYDTKLAADDHDPPGFFLGWTPGYAEPLRDDGLNWPLEKDADIVLELHLFGTGKRETIQSSVALYFASAPSDRYPCVVKLAHDTIDIPAGTKDYVLADQYVLPVDARVLSIYPHAHFICKDMKVYAIRPDGEKVWLLRIANWDFNWQNSYLYTAPIELPKGTAIHMRFVYDNSADNPRNPHNPPERVRFGPNTEDEMGEVTLQLLPRSLAETRVLASDFGRKDIQNDLARYRAQLEWHPGEAEAHYALGVTYRRLEDIPKAMHYYQQAIRLDPRHVFAHNNLGTLFLMTGRFDDAIVQYTQALKISPNDAKARNNLGLTLLNQGKLDQAAVQFEAALKIVPKFAEAETNLGRIAAHRGDLRKAAVHFERALRANPEYEDARDRLQQVQGQLRRG